LESNGRGFQNRKRRVVKIDPVRMFVNRIKTPITINDKMN
jgi:hypothetical protein